MPPTTLEYDAPSTIQEVGRNNEWISTKSTSFQMTEQMKYMDFVNLSDFDLTLKKELHRLASLQKNWDRQGAYPIDPEIIAAAREFVSTLPGRLKSRISTPAVVPMRKGNLQFEWHDGPRTLELEIEAPRTVHYLKWHAEAGIEEEDVCSISDANTIIGLIDWFAKG